jgi:hypothetical protein
MNRERGVRGTIYTQFIVTSVKLWITVGKMGINNTYKYRK